MRKHWKTLLPSGTVSGALDSNNLACNHGSAPYSLCEFKQISQVFCVSISLSVSQFLYTSMKVIT